jgi:hypothetical protein
MPGFNGLGAASGWISLQLAGIGESDSERQGPERTSETASDLC